MKWLYLIIRRFISPKCRHRFIVFGSGRINYTWGGANYKTNYYYHLRCEKCGELEYRELGGAP